MAFTPITELDKGGFKPIGQLQPDQSAAVLGHSNMNILQNLSTGFAKSGTETALGLGGIGQQIEGGLAKGAEALGAHVSPQATGEQGVFNHQSEVGQKAQQIVQPQGVMQKIGGYMEKAAEFLTPFGPEKTISKGAQVAKDVVETIRPPVKLATSRLSSTAETLTKSEREAAIKEGRMTTSGKYTPSKTELRAGEIMKGKTYSNPVKTVSAVQKEISTRGAEAEEYLTKNIQKISNKEDFDAFQSARSSSEKYMTPAESNAYDEQVGVFQKILKDYSSKEGGGYNTANYYKALKDYESQVTANLAKGKDALLTPGGAARIQAAKDVRSVVREMVGKKNPEFKGKMFDLASLYDSLDNVVAKAEQGGATFAKRHPFVTRAAETGAGVLGVEGIKKELGF